MPPGRSSPGAFPTSSGRKVGNDLFKIQDYAGALNAYMGCLGSNAEEQLPLLSNIGLCYLKLGDSAAAETYLMEAMNLTPALIMSPKIAAKAAQRLLEAYENLGDTAGQRRALCDLRFFLRKVLPGGLTGLKALPAVDEEAAFKFNVALMNAPHDARGVERVRAAMATAAPEAYDSHGESPMNVGIKARYKLHVVHAGARVIACVQALCESAGRGPESYGFQVLQMMLQAGT